VLADSDIDYGVQRVIVVTRFAVLDFHRALSDARQQSDKVDSVSWASVLRSSLDAKRSVSEGAVHLDWSSTRQATRRI
jgi:hypothetical protein